MAIQAWTDSHTQRALEVWREYERTHDVTALHGKAVGIDPVSGRVWFGNYARDVAQAARADGVTARLLTIRVGLGYYQRKGGRR
jgi:hypothetical protein